MAALLKVKTDLLEAMDNKKVTCLVLLDLSVAFDMVSRDLLLNWLKYTFGFTDTILKWICNYLTCREQCVVIGSSKDAAMPETATLTLGVPQGSILGPALFTLYTSPLGDLCRKHDILFHGYADDQHNYFAFSPNTPGDKDRCLEKLETCIQDIRIWIRTNLLKLNDEKTEFIMIGTKSQLTKSDYINSKITIGSDEILNTTSGRDLGFHLDCELKNKTHINKLTSTLYTTIKHISSTHHCLDEERTKILVQALVVSKLNYCNSMPIGSAQYNIDKLQ